MRTKKKIFLALTGLVLLAALSGYYYVFVYSNNYKRNIKKEKAEKLEAPALVTLYQQNEPAANTRFLDKTLLVSGKIMSTGANAEGKTTVLLEGDTLTGKHVFCTFIQPVSGIKTGDRITVRGICTGFMNDVILSDVLQNQP